MDAVKGHSCEGLQNLNENANHCQPIINKRGVILGCDDESDHAPIKFCPFCGVELENSDE